MNQESSSTLAPFDIIILGGGAIGCSTLLYCALRIGCQHQAPRMGGESPFRILLLDAADDIATCASGNAGGFLAKNWCNGEGPVEHLSKLSFEMHCRFGEKRAAEIGFRKMPAFQMELIGSDTKKKNNPTASKQQEEEEEEDGSEANTKKTPSWLDGDIAGKSEPLSDGEETAQVHPNLLCKAMVAEAKRLAESAGFVVEVRTKSPVQKLLLDAETGKCRGVVVAGDGVVLGAKTAVVLTLGPWSAALESMIHTSSSSAAAAGDSAQRKMTTTHNALTQLSRSFRPHKVQSVILKCATPFQEAIFTSASADFESSADYVEDCEPEIYPRPDGTVYLCGISDHDQLPGRPGDVQPSVAGTDLLAAVGAKISSKLASGAEIVARQACYLPTTSQGRRPIIGEVPGSDGSLLFASGHTCWGILWSHGTGLALAEMIDSRHFGKEGAAREISSKITALQPRYAVDVDIDDDVEATSYSGAGKRGNEKW